MVAVLVSHVSGLWRRMEMTINELIRELQALVAEDEYRGDAAVTFGSDMEPVLGGIITRHQGTGLVVLNLAPTKLDRVGGF